MQAEIQHGDRNLSGSRQQFYVGLSQPEAAGYGTDVRTSVLESGSLHRPLPLNQLWPCACSGSPFFLYKMNLASLHSLPALTFYCVRDFGQKYPFGHQEKSCVGTKPRALAIRMHSDYIYWGVRSGLAFSRSSFLRPPPKNHISISIPFILLEFPKSFFSEELEETWLLFYFAYFLLSSFSKVNSVRQRLLCLPCLGTVSVI